MGLVSLGFKILSAFSLLLLMIGLYKPWIVLWWEDVQHRLKVIRLYGSVSLVAIVIAWMIDNWA